jgi:hypothetical protein
MEVRIAKLERMMIAQHTGGKMQTALVNSRVLGPQFNPEAGTALSSAGLSEGGLKHLGDGAVCFARRRRVPLAHLRTKRTG